MLNGVLPDEQADGVRGFALQMALLDVEHLVEEAAHVEAQAQEFFRAEGLPVFARQQPAMVREGEFQLVAVMIGLGGAQDGGDFRKIQVADAGELIDDLLLLESDLHRIGQRLPGAAAAVLEMRAEGLEPVRGRGFHPGDVALGVAAAHFVDLHVHHVARDALPDKDDFSVHVGQAVAFGRSGLDGDIFQVGFCLSRHFLSVFRLLRFGRKVNQRISYI